MNARVPALCCTCGNVRTVSTGYSAGHTQLSACESLPAATLADCWSRGYYLEHEPGWRCLTLLKCDHCGERTRHALIRDDEHRNFAEQEDRRRDARRRWPLVP